MSILNAKEIFNEIEQGKIKIDPFSPESVKDASVELTLSNEFGRLKELHYPINSLEVDPNRPIVEWERANKVFMLAPQKCVVGKTKEKITLPEDIAGWITGRGKLTLLGLNLQISTGFVQPNTKNEELFFLITNLGTASVSLAPDTKICQLILFRL